MSPDIVFEESRIGYLLDLFDKEADRDGYIVDSETNQRVTYEGTDTPIKTAELGVVGHSSEIFVRDEVDSIVEFVNSRHESDGG